MSAERPGVRFPPPLLYVGAFAAGVVLELAFPTGQLPTALAVLAGVAALAVWAWLDAGATLLFSRAGTGVPPWSRTTALVTAGPYEHTRNPMYLGMAVLYAGAALAFGVLWALLLLPLVVLAVDRLVIPAEERYLEAHFGEEYRRYRGRVRRWL